MKDTFPFKVPGFHNTVCVGPKANLRVNTGLKALCRNSRFEQPFRCSDVGEKGKTDFLPFSADTYPPTYIYKVSPPFLASQGAIELKCVTHLLIISTDFTDVTLVSEITN